MSSNDISKTPSPSGLLSGSNCRPTIIRPPRASSVVSITAHCDFIQENFPSDPFASWGYFCISEDVRHPMEAYSINPHIKYEELDYFPKFPMMDPSEEQRRMEAYHAISGLPPLDTEAIKSDQSTYTHLAFPVPDTFLRRAKVYADRYSPDTLTITREITFHAREAANLFVEAYRHIIQGELRPSQQPAFIDSKGNPSPLPREIMIYLESTQAQTLDGLRSVSPKQMIEEISVIALLSLMEYVATSFPQRLKIYFSPQAKPPIDSRTRLDLLELMHAPYPILSKRPGSSIKLGWPSTTMHVVNKLLEYSSMLSLDEVPIVQEIWVIWAKIIVVFVSFLVYMDEVRDTMGMCDTLSMLLSECLITPFVPLKVNLLGSCECISGIDLSLIDFNNKVIHVVFHTSSGFRYRFNIKNIISSGNTR